MDTFTEPGSWQDPIDVMSHQIHQHVINNIKCFSDRLNFRDDRPNLCDSPIDDERLVHALCRGGLPSMTPAVLGNFMHLLIAHADDLLFNDGPRTPKPFWALVVRAVAAKPDVGGFFIPWNMAQLLVHEVVRARLRYEDFGNERLSQQMRADRQLRSISIQISEGAARLRERLGGMNVNILGNGLWENLHPDSSLPYVSDSEFSEEVDDTPLSPRSRLRNGIDTSERSNDFCRRLGNALHREELDRLYLQDAIDRRDQLDQWIAREEHRLEERAYSYARAGEVPNNDPREAPGYLREVASPAMERAYIGDNQLVLSNNAHRNAATREQGDLQQNRGLRRSVRLQSRQMRGPN